ncbi:hypothetical protein [Flavobacterium cerinum]|uniref:Uncharacterized protein n=1 Tax=Flavobacterium cerinum TaxID=2502784 RepID=A0ABY5IS63_9FLAO|nr:hypothetical protein [Flavobacterium cerinum]UUC44387.1 hypothetical protein NOX80_12160 [Flavobacterium cerinum]
MMKSITAILVALFLALSVNAQEIRKERKTAQIMPSQTFYLNGGNRAVFGGKSRAIFNIVLPPNTVEWYYSVTVAKGRNSDVNIGLLGQLTKLYDPTGITALATNLILTPSATGMCDIFLMDTPNSTNFINKTDKWSRGYRYYNNESREKFQNGTIQIKTIRAGNWYLGFKNPSATQGVSITFEAVAIVE